MGLDSRDSSLSRLVFQDLDQNSFGNGHGCSWPLPLAPSCIHFLILTKTQIMHFNAPFESCTFKKGPLCRTCVDKHQLNAHSGEQWSAVLASTPRHCNIPVPEEHRPGCQMSLDVSAYIYHCSNSDTFVSFLSYLHQIKRPNVWVRPLAQRSLHVGYGDWESNPELPPCNHTGPVSKAKITFFIVILLCVRGLTQMG